MRGRNMRRNEGDLGPKRIFSASVILLDFYVGHV